ncbi:hypothetical protein TNCV_1166911 [Trichonephila clavipes]|uniref:Uncharacterized protein n=1 Tax=Trichonephila clavipes TaxID=2585209 RepID=A0A8X6T8M3_TRICX|nr:hypothetical protein TNCV_1166911 [Trichonephila clavipes]
MSRKLSKKCSSGMEFKSLVTFRCMSGISSNLFPFKASLSHGDRKKSGRLRYGEYGGCSVCTPPFAPPFRQNPVRSLNVPASDRQVMCCTRAIDDGPPNFESWSSDEDDTCAGLTSPNFHTIPTGGCLSFDRFNVHRQNGH